MRRALCIPDCSRRSHCHCSQQSGCIAAVLPQTIARIEKMERNLALLTRDSSSFSKLRSSDATAAKPGARRPMKSKKRVRHVKLGHKGLNNSLGPHDRKPQGNQAPQKNPGVVTFCKWMLSETGKMLVFCHALKHGDLERQIHVLQPIPVRARTNKFLQEYLQSLDY